jgi:hypothetical protein
MAAKPTEHYISGFGDTQWTGLPLKDSGSMFIGFGFMTFLLCLLLMIFIPPLRATLAVIVVCTVVATIAMVVQISFNIKRDKATIADMAARVNAFILELTGDPNAQVSRGKIRSLIEDNRRGVPLSINGVPGVEVKVVREKDQATRFVAVLTPPDYGLESFDVLLDAERKRKP